MRYWPRPQPPADERRSARQRGCTCHPVRGRAARRRSGSRFRPRSGRRSRKRSLRVQVVDLRTHSAPTSRSTASITTASPRILRVGICVVRDGRRGVVGGATAHTTQPQQQASAPARRPASGRRQRSPITRAPCGTPPVYPQNDAPPRPQRPRAPPHSIPPPPPPPPGASAPLCQTRPLHLHLIREARVVQQPPRQRQAHSTAHRLDKHDAARRHEAQARQHLGGDGDGQARAGAIDQHERWALAQHE